MGTGNGVIDGLGVTVGAQGIPIQDGDGVALAGTGPGIVGVSGVVGGGFGRTY